MAAASFARVEQLPVSYQQLKHFNEKVNQAILSSESTKKIVLHMQNFSFPRIKEIADHYLNRQGKIGSIHICVQEGEWAIDDTGRWFCNKHTKLDWCGHSEPSEVSLHLFSMPRGLYAEKESVLKQLYLGIIPFIKAYKEQYSKIDGWGRIDLGELDDKDFKIVVSELREKMVAFELAPFCNYVSRCRDKGYSINVIRELIINLKSINLSSFDYPISKRKLSFFKMPEPTKTDLSVEDCCLQIRDELEFVAKSSPLVRRSQHDISALDPKFYDKILIMLDKQGYPAEIDGPYVKANIFGRCRLCTTLTIDLPAVPKTD